MFNLFKSKSQGTKIILSISGMHCVSCGLTIDDSIEELPGVIKSRTSYAKSQIEVEYNPQKIAPEKIITVVNSLSYEVEVKK